ncbi:MAG: hypothetical protein Rhims3KO_35880 [Hyphomicrobiales bacterium]
MPRLLTGLIIGTSATHVSTCLTDKPVKLFHDGFVFTSERDILSYYVCAPGFEAIG